MSARVLNDIAAANAAHSLKGVHQLVEWLHGTADQNEGPRFLDHVTQFLGRVEQQEAVSATRLEVRMTVICLLGVETVVAALLN